MTDKADEQGGNKADVALLRQFVRRDAAAAAALERVVAYGDALRHILGNAIGPALQATRDDLHRHYNELERRFDRVTASTDSVVRATAAISRMHDNAARLIAGVKRLTVVKKKKKKARRKR